MMAPQPHIAAERNRLVVESFAADIFVLFGSKRCSCLAVPLAFVLPIESHHFPLLMDDCSWQDADDDC